MNIEDSKIELRFRLTTWVSSLFAVLGSLVGLHIWILKQAVQINGNWLTINPEILPSMNFFALLLLMLSGIFLLISPNILIVREYGKFFQGLAKIIVTLVICFALILFLQTLWSMSLNINGIAKHQVATNGVLNLEELPLNLTLSFLLLGIGLLTIDKEIKVGQRPSQYLAFVVFILAFYSLLGVLYEFVFVNHSLAYTLAVALTAISLMALAIGIFCSRPDKGILVILQSESSGGLLARHLFPSAIMIPVLLGGLIFLGLQAGYYNAILGIALLSVTQIIIFQMIFWRNSLLIHHLDTERLQAKEELSKAYEKLAERVKNQTAEIEVKTKALTQEVNAREKIQEALSTEVETTNRIKDEFLAIISHELRSPLNSILGWATMLKNGKLDPEMSTKAIDIIERSAQSQNVLINDLLDISMIISGKIRLQICPIHPEVIVENAVESLRPMAEAKGLMLTQDIYEDISPVSGDIERLQQAVRNLIANAIKFTPSGGHIEVKLRNHENVVIISVTDTGIGIAPHFLPYVFDRFRQADSSHTRKHGGLGLGLSIARHLVELHGGMIGVESAGEGKGSTFVIELPQQLKNVQEEYKATRQINSGSLNWNSNHKQEIYI